MAPDIDKFVRDLQEAIMRDIRVKYSPTVIEHWMNPINFKKMEECDGYGKVTGSCGDTMEVYVRVVGEKVREASFFTDGCGSTIACGSMIACLVRNKTIMEARQINQRVVLDALGGLPPQDEHCAELAANALRYALVDYETAPSHGKEKGH